jgi:hypothetical protein
MILFTSSKLSSLLAIKTKLQPEANAHPLQYWNAQLFSVDKRKCIIMTNKTTLYSLLALDVVKKDIVPFEVFFWKALVANLKNTGLHTPAIEASLRKTCLPIHVSTTNNDKKVIGTMNDHIYTVKYFAWDTNHISDLEVAKMEERLNDTPCGANGYEYPVKRMKAVLGNL